MDGAGTMEASEAAEMMEPHGSGDRMKRVAALLIGILAMLLAIAGLGGSNAAKEMTNNNIAAANAWAFFQAKNARQTSFRLAADELELALLREPGMPAEARQRVQTRIAEYRATVARYESDPKENDGKKELIQRAKAHEAARNHAQAQDPYFDYSEALFQIAIVLCSVAIVAGSVPLLWIGGSLGIVATLLMLNGFFLAVHLPFLH